MNYAPQILTHTFKEGTLAEGECGALVARTLLTVAHDLAILKNPERDPCGESKVSFHRPIRLLDLLENLFVPEVWDAVCKASPFHASPDGLPLQTAFANAWVNFSQFTQFTIENKFEPRFVCQLLKRGIAAQADTYKQNQDIGIPVLLGDPGETKISEENTGLVQIQVKNSVSCDRPFPRADARENPGNLPVLSIVMELGINESEFTDKQVAIPTTPKGNQGPNTQSMAGSSPIDVDQCHYVITIYGCTRDTYSCIAKEGKKDVYAIHLRPKDFISEFNWQGIDGAAEVFLALNPEVIDRSIA